MFRCNVASLTVVEFRVADFELVEVLLKNLATLRPLVVWDGPLGMAPMMELRRQNFAFVAHL